LRARLRRLGFGVVAFFDQIYRLKDRKNGGFRADPLAKYHRLSFFRKLFKDFRKILYAKMRHVPLRTGATTFATLVYRCLSALLRTEKDKAREDELPVKQGIVNVL
jgi:hypothetical protein